jgi:hypothetical protein
MTQELQDYLIKKFPKIYTDCPDDSSFKSYGFECGDGWFRLILWLSRYLQQYIDEQNVWANKYPDQYRPVQQIKVVQIKEKFATLRIYTHGGNEHTKSIIGFVEYISGFVCEKSGRTDDVCYNKNGWMKTMHIDLFDASNCPTHVDDDELRTILSKIQ